MIGNKTYSEHDAVTVCRTVSGRLKIAGHQKLYRLTVLAKRLTGRCGAKPPRTKAPHHSPESPTNRKHIRARTIYGPKSSSIIWETMASRMVVFRERFSTFFFSLHRSYTDWQIRMLGDLVKTDCQISNPLLTIDAKMTADNYVFIENIFSITNLLFCR